MKNAMGWESTFLRSYEFEKNCFQLLVTRRVVPRTEVHNSLCLTLMPQEASLVADVLKY